MIDDLIIERDIRSVLEKEFEANRFGTSLTRKTTEPKWSCKALVSDLLVEAREIMNRDLHRVPSDRNLCSTRKEL